jgi:hypothetical protein
VDLAVDTAPLAGREKIDPAPGGTAIVGVGDARPVDDGVGVVAVEFPQAVRDKITTAVEARIFTSLPNAVLRPKLRHPGGAR